MRPLNKMATNNFIMRAWLAILFTVCLLVISYIVSAFICFDVSWILIGVTSLWAGIDSKKIGLYRYKLGFACRPIAVFCLCYVFWILFFPWYLWVRFKIKAGEINLKDESFEGLGTIKRFFRRFSRIADRIGEWLLAGIVGLKIAFYLSA